MRLPPLFQPATWGSDLEPLDLTLSCCCLRRKNSGSFNFKFSSEALHKRSGNDADWLHKFTSWLLWYGQSWEMAGTWLFQFSWYQILGQLQLYSCAPLVLFDIFQRPNITKVRVQVTGDCWRRDQAFKFWPWPRWGCKQWKSGWVNMKTNIRRGNK